MPSQRHEALLQLFRNRPALAAELLRDALHMQIPVYTDVRIDSAEFSDIQPVQYRADQVILLLKGKPVLGIVLEVQLRRDEQKRYAWPAYIVNLRARIRADTAKSARIALAAYMAASGLDADRSTLYCDLILHSLPEAARRALQAMDIEDYEFQSAFARKYVKVGRIEIILEMLAMRYGPLSKAIKTRVRRTRREGLKEIAERLLTAETLEEAVGLVEA